MIARIMDIDGFTFIVEEVVNIYVNDGNFGEACNQGEEFHGRVSREFSGLVFSELRDEFGTCRVDIDVSNRASRVSHRRHCVVVAS